MTPEIALLSESPQAEVRVTLPREPLDENDDMAVETFILLVSDELGLAPANVFFRQSVVNIEDTCKSIIRCDFEQDKIPYSCFVGFIPRPLPHYGRLLCSFTVHSTYTRE